MRANIESNAIRIIVPALSSADVQSIVIHSHVCHFQLPAVATIP